MINGNFTNTPVRRIVAKAELYNGSALADTFNHNGDLKEFKVERVGDNSKFFGFGIIQKANVKVRNVDGTKSITTANSLKLYLNDVAPYPLFNVSEVHKDENTNELSITAYDALNKASAHKVEELGITSYTIRSFAEACAALLGISAIKLENVVDSSSFDTQYDEGANFEGTETIREALNAVAEVTQTIYYLNNANELVFKRLDKDGAAVLDITKSDYITLESKTNRRLATLVSATELGDNLTATKQIASGTGKNLLPYPYYETTKTENGITFTDNGDGTITANGTATAVAIFYFTEENKQFDWLTDKTYFYISGAQGVSGIGMKWFYTDNGESIVKQGRLIWSKDFKLIRFGVQIEAGTTLNNAIIQPMVEQAANATTYEPYTIHYTPLIGTTQYIRDNPFWDLREDRATLLENAVAAVGGLLINQFNCSWRGNYLLEIGDKIGLTTKDNKVVCSYVLDDLVEYTGSLQEQTQWSYSESESASSTNPTNIGDAIKQTFAKVDKVNKQIDMVVSETEANSEEVAAMRLETNRISATVSSTSQAVQSATDELSKEINTLTNRVNTAVTAQDVQIAIQTELANGTNTVTTSTGFTFNEEGLSVSKSGSEMETKITEDGMIVNKDNKEVLIANNKGVKAIDLHAETYLIIGTNSRFEDYGSNRTGCFWIG
jgi:hypothetical protein